MNHWRAMLRIVLKAAVLFVLANLIFALINPIEALGHVSLYNVILPGRERLPYGENPSLSYNISLYSVPAMFASDVVARPKAADEYRVFLIGDSSTWGWLLENKDTYASIMNQVGYKAPDGRRIVFYNLGYPIESLTKDLLLLDEAMQYQPDMVVWLVTLQSFRPSQQLSPPLVQNNTPRIRDLIGRYHLALNPNDSNLVDPDFIGKTIVGQRRALADWLRLQLYGFSWAATGIDQYIPATYTPHTVDFNTDVSWDAFKAPTTLKTSDLAFDVLKAGVERVGKVPMVIVNEPMFISNGKNSSLRYNAFYPRWAYDQYRALLQQQADANGWHYFDWWDSVDPSQFTDSPVHLTPAGAEELGGLFGRTIVKVLS